MKYFVPPYSNYKFSHFAIGTVQLGLDYGIDILGKPSKAEAVSILKLALREEINIFDTSPDYGESEEIIGEVLSNTRKQNIYLITKLNSYRYNKKAWESRDNISKKIRDDLNLSCYKLKVNKIPIYLVHNASDAFRNHGIVLNELKKIKEEGKIDFIGVSLYTSTELEKCIEDRRVDSVQIPFNVLDRRLANSGLLKKAKKRGLVIFARSIYLQGLLLMDTNRIPKHLGEIIRFVNELKNILKYSKRNMKEICLKYVLSIDEISSIIIGIGSLEQLKENIKIFNSPPLEKDLIEAIEELPIPPDYLLNPSKWNDLKKDKP